MSFKNHFQTLTSLSILFFLPACGLLGQRDTSSQLSGIGAGGCLNDVGPQFTRYFEGKAEKAKWEATWDCTINSLALFQRFVKGSNVEGFTAKDMNTFITTFLLSSDKKVSVDFISSVIELKASFLGGKKDVIAYKELDQVIELLKVLKLETSKLIPHLNNRVNAPTQENLAALSAAIASGVSVIGQKLTARSAADLEYGTLVRLVNGMRSSLKVNFDTKYLPFIFTAKKILFGGSDQLFESALWNEVFTKAGMVFGPGIAIASAQERFFTEPNQLAKFIYQVAFPLKSIFQHALELDGGSLKFAHLDNLIDSMPDEWMVLSNGKYTLPKDVVKQTLRPFFNKLLGSKSPDSITTDSFDVIFNLAKRWNTRQAYLETIYRNKNASTQGITREEFVTAANEVLSTVVDVSEQNEINELIAIAKNYKPIFIAADNQISFVPWTGYSLGNLSKIHTMSLAVRLYIDTYAPVEGIINEAKLTELVIDFQDLLYAFRFLDNTKVDEARKRFREADLFTYASDGNGQLDEFELTYYLAFLYSASSLTDRIRADIEPLCKTDSKDRLDWYWMESNCFRQEYAKRLERYWYHFPQLMGYYNRLSENEQKKLLKNMETGFLSGVAPSMPYGSQAVRGIGAYIQYIECVFSRFDKDTNQILDTKETLSAYPVFRKLLKDTQTGNTSDKLLEAGFTYAINYKKKPATKGWGLFHFLSWYVRKPFWKIQADRGAVFSVVPIFLVAPPKNASEPSFIDLTPDLSAEIQSNSDAPSAE